MSALQLSRGIAARIHRRRFLSRVLRTAFAVAVGVAVMPVQAIKAACCTHCARYETSRRVGCCDLGFFNNCNGLDCFNDANQWWLWTCCDGLNKKWYCYECCPWSCSHATQQGMCPFGPASSTASAAA